MKKVPLGLVVVFLTLLGAESALACVCPSLPNPTPEQIRAGFARELKNASVVFSGEVIYLDKFKVKFKVEKVWKGDATEEIIMSTGTKDNGDGTIRMTSCDYRFELGEKYVVYARGSGEEMQTYECTGTGRVEHSEQRIKFLEEMSSKKGEKLL